MIRFRLHLMSPKKEERFDDVVCFTGRDSSGSFNILSDASRRMTALVFGLAQFRTSNAQIEYLALPGGLLYFLRNELRLITSHYARDSNYETITHILNNEVQKQESEIQETKRSIRRLDEEILKRMVHLGLGIEI